MNPFLLRTYIATGLLLWAAGAAQASVMPWKMTGTVASISSSPGATVTAPMMADDAFELVFTVDTSIAATATIDGGPTNFTSAAYPAITQMTFAIPTRGLTIVNDGGPAEMSLSHFVLGDDQWKIIASNTVATSSIPSAGTDSSNVDMVFDSFALQLMAPGDFDVFVPHPTPIQPDPTWVTGMFHITWSNPNEGGGYTMILTTDSFVNIPEPTSLALLGLGGLIAMRRRRSTGR